jgi:hypothetical protein
MSISIEIDGTHHKDGRNSIYGLILRMVGYCGMFGINGVSLHVALMTTTAHLDYFLALTAWHMVGMVGIQVERLAYR